MTEKVLQVAGGRAKWCSDFRKVWQFLVKLNILLPNGPAVSQLKELKTCAHQELCESVISSFFFFFLFFGVGACRILFPQSRNGSCVSCSGSRVLIAGLLGKSSY